MANKRVRGRVVRKPRATPAATDNGKKIAEAATVKENMPLPPEAPTPNPALTRAHERAGFREGMRRAAGSTGGQPPVPALNEDQITANKMAVDLARLEIALRKSGLSIVGMLRELARKGHGFRG